MSGTVNVVEVARACGVSPSTVCRALNGRADISRKTRGLILRYCAKAGYSKNLSASLLRSRTSDAFVAIMPDFSNELFIDKLYALKRQVISSGRAWQLRSFGSAGEAEKLFLETAGARPAGIISAFQPGSETRKIIRRNRIAAVFFDCDARGFDSVVLDRRKGVFDAVRHMIRKGRKRILLLGSGLEGERGLAYSDAHAASGIRIDRSLIISKPFGHNLFEYGYDETKAVLGKIPFDGIMAVNDACAIGAMRALSEHGLRIPQDASVCGFDDIMVSRYTVPSLTTVSQPTDKMAEAAVGLLLRRISSPESRRRTASLATCLIVRES